MAVYTIPSVDVTLVLVCCVLGWSGCRVVNFQALQNKGNFLTHKPLSLLEGSPVLTEDETGWDPEKVWMLLGEGKNLLPVTELEPRSEHDVASSLLPNMPPRLRNFKQGHCKIRRPEEQATTNTFFQNIPCILQAKMFYSMSQTNCLQKYVYVLNITEWSEVMWVKWSKWSELRWSSCG